MYTESVNIGEEEKDFFSPVFLSKVYIDNQRKKKKKEELLSKL